MATTRIGGSARRATVSAASPRPTAPDGRAVPAGSERRRAAHAGHGERARARGRQDGWNQRDGQRGGRSARGRRRRAPTRTSAPLGTDGCAASRPRSRGMRDERAGRARARPPTGATSTSSSPTVADRATRIWWAEPGVGREAAESISSWSPVRPVTVTSRPTVVPVAPSASHGKTLPATTTSDERGGEDDRRVDGRTPRHQAGRAGGRRRPRPAAAAATRPSDRPRAATSPATRAPPPAAATGVPRRASPSRTTGRPRRRRRTRSRRRRPGRSPPPGRARAPPHRPPGTTATRAAPTARAAGAGLEHAGRRLPRAAAGRPPPRRSAGRPPRPTAAGRAPRRRPSPRPTSS